MEFNAGIFSFTGTRSNPLNIFQLRLLTWICPLQARRPRPERRSAWQFYFVYQRLISINVSLRRLLLGSAQPMMLESRADFGPRLAHFVLDHCLLFCTVFRFG